MAGGVRPVCSCGNGRARGTTSRYLDASWVGRAFHPGVRAEDAVEQYDERTLRRVEATREVDAHDARPAEANGEPAVRADDGTPDETRWGEAGRPRSHQVLGLVDPDVHEVARVGPDPIDPVGADDFEPPPLGAQIGSVREDAPDTRVHDEEPGGIEVGGHEHGEEVD